MEERRSSYRILFNLACSLEGYRDDLNQYLRLVPDQTATQQFGQYQMLARKQKNTGVSLIEVVPQGPNQGKPLVVPKEGSQFEFQLKFPDPQFLLRTHLGSYDFTDQVLVVSNQANHIEGGQVLLSKPLEVYDSSKAYKKGYLVHAGTSFFKAIRESHASDAHPVTEADYWKPIADGGFLSQADLQSRSPAVDLDAIIVIQIKHSSSLPAGYQLLDPSLKCREVSYQIRFLRNS